MVEVRHFCFCAALISKDVGNLNTILEEIAVKKDVWSSVCAVLRTSKT